MGKLSQMSGTPWHIETVPKNKLKRNNPNQCNFYDSKSKQCKSTNKHCVGTDMCLDFWDKSIVDIKDNTSRSNIKPHKASVSEENRTLLFPENCRVRHKHFGEGTVVSVSNGEICVLFDTRGEKHFDLKSVVKDKSIRRV